MIQRAADSMGRSTGNIARARVSNPFSGLIQRAITSVTPKAPKQGPRGVTIDDVGAVAAGSVPGWRPGKPLPSAQQLADARLNAGPAFTQESVLPNLVGGPAPGYGQRYGGFKTGTEAEAQILGQAYNAKIAGQLAQEQADVLANQFETEYERLVNPQGSAVQQTLANNQKITGTSLGTLARQMAGGRTPSQQDYYGAHMAIQNALRGTGRYSPEKLSELGREFNLGRPLNQAEANALEMVRRPAALNLQAGLQTSGALDAQDLANAINALSVSDLAQRMAIQEYGYDPGMAAGIFTPEEDLNYEQAMYDAQKAQIMRDNPNANPDLTVAEMILQTYGVEGLQQYHAQQAEYALNGTPTQQLAAGQREQEARDALYDESVRQKYGFDPNEVPNIDAQVVRELTLNEDFTTLLDEARQKVLDGDSALDLASEYSQKYLEKSKESGMADNVGATAMGEIIASFDLSYFD